MASLKTLRNRIASVKATQKALSDELRGRLKAAVEAFAATFA